MPKAKPALDLRPPHPLRDDEATVIKAIIAQFYGENAVIRNFGPDPKWLQLHVEIRHEPSRDTYDHCMGQLLCRIERHQISLTIWQHSRRVRGAAKIAYRQGVIL